MSLSVQAGAEAETVEVVDTAERHRFALSTDGAVDPRSVDTGRVDAPVDAAVAVEAARVELPNVVAVYVRDADRRTVAEAEHFADIDLPPGRYTVELATPIKTYLQVEGPLRVVADAERTTISVGQRRSILVGARSRQDHPEHVVTTTDDPADVMTAVSALSAALKETSPERSYPTLRGHPARIELGDELDVPAGMEPPETGVRVEVPPDLGSVFVAAPLAFYLGAELVPGEEPRLVAEEADLVHRLDGPGGLAGAVERTLKQVFLLDCCVRTEGLYRVDLHEREAIEELLPAAPAALYDAPLAAQLRAYLSVPYEALESHVPEWKLTTHVAPEAESVELLPFLLDDLALVRLPDHADTGSAGAAQTKAAEAEAAAIEQFVRDGGFTRSAGEGSRPSAATVRPGEADSLEQAWVGDGAPLGASKPTVEAFHNRIDRRHSDGDIDITVVCNDAEMAEERDLVGEAYGDRDGLPFDVSVHHDLTVAELETVLATEADFLHYIGHIDDEGFECADGKLDAAGLETVGVDAFFLNACQSYDQGMALIEAGSIGGVVTLREVVNSGAVAVGSTLARLLNRGFPLRSGLEVARDESVMGNQYVVVGDGGLGLTQTESGAALLCRVSETDPAAETEAEWELSIETYTTSDGGMGSMIMPILEDVDAHYLCSGEVDTYRLDTPELIDFLGLENMPVYIEGELRWSEPLRAEIVS